MEVIESVTEQLIDILSKSQYGQVQYPGAGY